MVTSRSSHCRHPHLHRKGFITLGEKIGNLEKTILRNCYHLILRTSMDQLAPRQVGELVPRYRPHVHTLSIPEMESEDTAQASQTTSAHLGASEGKAVLCHGLGNTFLHTAGLTACLLRNPRCISNLQLGSLLSWKMSCAPTSWHSTPESFIQQEANLTLKQLSS